MTFLPMSAEAAAWVRANVWTDALQRDYTEQPGHLTRCPCQYGPSGHCSAGRHDWCAHRIQPAFYARQDLAETWICRADGTLATHAGELVPVRLADRSCRWRCPCDCHQQTPQDRGLLFDLCPTHATPTTTTEEGRHA